MLQLVRHHVLVGVLAMGACLVGAYLVGARPAEATTLDNVEAECPACDRQFVAKVVRSTNTFGGVDADLCAHANGYQPLSYRNWTCPRCAYSRLHVQFEDDIPDAVAKWARDELTSPVPIAETASQEEIPGWVKHELAAQVLQKLGEDEASVALEFLAGAQTERVESDQLMQAVWDDDDLDPAFKAISERFDALYLLLPWDRAGTRNRSGRNVHAATALLKSAETEDAKELDSDLTRLFGAWVLREYGECRPAEPILEELAKREGQRDSIRTVAQALMESIERERSFLRRCAGKLDRLMDVEHLRGRRGARQLFTAAEVHRRLGNAEEAESNLVLALSHSAVPDVVRVASREAAALPGDMGSAYEAAVDEYWPAWLDGLVGELADPETTESAGEKLALLSEPSTVPGMVSALASEDADVRWNAASAMGTQRGLDLEALTALRARAADAEEEDEVRWACVETLVQVADPGSAELFRALLADDTWFLPDEPVEGLGLVGDAQDVPRIAALRDEIPDVAARALSILTNRNATDSGGFDAWWKTNKDLAREDWVRAGFADRLTNAESLAAPENVPVLIELLEDERRYARLNAHRALRETYGRSIGLREILSEGRIPYGDPRRPPGMPELLADGEILVLGGPMLDLNALDPALARPLQLPYAKSNWERAAARWKQWWREQPK